MLPEPSRVHDAMLYAYFWCWIEYMFSAQELTFPGGHTDLDLHKELKNKMGVRHEKIVHQKRNI